MGWEIIKIAGASAISYPLNDVSISLSLNGMNIADATVSRFENSALDVDDFVNISYNNTILFSGIIDTITQQSAAMYRVKMSERANELQNLYVENDIGYVVTVDNEDAPYKTISEFVAYILNSNYTTDTGWEDISVQNIKDAQKPPNVTGADYFSSVLFRYVTCYDALNKFLVDVCDIKMRFTFDVSTGKKYLEYGTVLNPTDAYSMSTVNLDITDYVIEPLEDKDAFDYDIDKVVVIKAANSDIIGSAVATTPSHDPPKTAIYQYDSVTSIEEANSIATSLLNQRSNINVRKTITVPVGFSGVREGDYVTIGLEHFSVQDISYTTSETKIGLLGYFDSTWETFANKQPVRSSGSFGGIGSSNTLGWKETLESTGTYWQDGSAASWNMVIDDVTKLGDTITASCQIDNLKRIWDMRDSYSNVSNGNGEVSGTNSDENIANPNVTGDIVYTVAINNTLAIDKSPATLNIPDPSIDIDYGFQVVDTTTTSANVDGIYSGIAFVQLSVYNDNIGGYKVLTVKLEYSSDEINWYNATDYAAQVYVAPSLLSQTLFVPIIITADMSSITSALTWRASVAIFHGDGSNVSLYAAMLDMQLLSGHDHPIIETDNSLGLSDAPHSTLFSGNETYISSIDEGHQHEMEADGTAVSSYPTNISFSIENSGTTSPVAITTTPASPFAGGSQGTFKFTFPTSTLKNGENVIWMKSNTYGSACLTLNYLVFGDE